MILDRAVTGWRRAVSSKKRGKNERELLMTGAMQKKIDIYLKGIQDTIVAAEHNHDIWWIYKSRDTRPKFIDAMNTYLAFFQTSIHAHFIAVIIALYRLYQTPGGSGHRNILIL